MTTSMAVWTLAPHAREDCPYVPLTGRRSFRTSSKIRQRKKGSSKGRSAIAVQNVAIQPESEETRGFRECSLECRAGICEPGRLPRLPARGCCNFKPKLKPQLPSEKSRVRFSRQVVARLAAENKIQGTNSLLLTSRLLQQLCLDGQP